MTQLRASVKNILGFTEAGALCMRPRCKGIAAWRIGAVMWEPGTGHYPDNCARVRFNLYVCDHCKELTTLADIVDDRCWKQICRTMRADGHARPDRASLALEFIPLMMARA